MSIIKRFAKVNSHSTLIKPFAGLGRSINRFYENRNHNPNTNGELRILQKLYKFNPSVIFDVGANVGDYAELASISCPNAKIYSFEPVSTTFEILVKRVHTKKLTQVVPIEKGLFKEDKQIVINLYPSDEHASIHNLKGVNYSPVGQSTIEVVAGDHIIRELQLSSIDLLKLDVEGAEMDVLSGFQNAFKERMIRAVQFEYGYINITSKILLCDYYDFFKSCDYLVGKIYPKSVEFRDYEFKHEDFIGPNFLAIHKDDLDLIKSIS